MEDLRSNCRVVVKFAQLPVASSSIMTLLVNRHGHGAIDGCVILHFSCFTACQRGTLEGKRLTGGQQRVAATSRGSAVAWSQEC